MRSLFLIVLLLLSSNAHSQDAYKWKDSKGRTIYGTKPPKTKGQVESFKLRKLSTYSENKVLKRLGKVPEEKEKTPEFNISKKKGSTNKKTRALAVKENSSRSDVSEVMLRSYVPKLKFDDDGLIASCRVDVSNETDREAFEISVAFEFPDGSLVPAAGPFEMAANSIAEFYVPNELLPIAKKLGDNLGDSNADDSTLRQALPKVIIHSLGSR